MESSMGLVTIPNYSAMSEAGNLGSPAIREEIYYFYE